MVSISEQQMLCCLFADDWASNDDHRDFASNKTQNSYIQMLGNVSTRLSTTGGWAVSTCMYL